MKYLACLAALLLASLVVCGGALAKNHRSGHHNRHPAARHSTLALHRGRLLPRLEPRPGVWRRLLRDLQLEPLHRHAIRHRPARHRGDHRRSQHRPAHHRRSQQRASHRRAVVRRDRMTSSLYERTTRPSVLTRQGCRAARRHERGVAVLDFGKPAYHRHGYGTILFSDRFTLNHRITIAMLAYAHGYVRCLPRGSHAFVTLARGTSNYHPSLPSAYEAGVRWAREANALARLLVRSGLSDHVGSAAADDAEPAWDPRFHKTRDFIRGYRRAAHGRTLYDYGSLDGGVGAIWNARQAFFVASGTVHTRALPEIYNHAMAREWAELARIAKRRYHAKVHFAGVMTQGSSSCGCGLRPHKAHHALARALDSAGAHETVLPLGGTNIVG